MIVLLVLVAGGFYWWHFVRTPASKVVTKAGNFSSNTKPSNSANNPTAKKQPTGNSNIGRTISGATDTNGQSGTATNSSQWITSTSGNITVEQPIANATFASGDTLSGTAKVSSVNFRLIDNSVGVISEGSLNVVNGKFSGKINFTPHSSGGQLDVFSTDANGAEINEIQIAIKY